MATRLDGKYIVGNRFIKKITPTHVHLIDYDTPLEYNMLYPCDLTIIHGLYGDFLNLAECIFATIQTENIYVNFPSFEYEFKGELEFVDLPNLKSMGGYRIPNWAMLKQYVEHNGMWKYSYTWCFGHTDIVEHDDLFYENIEDLFLEKSMPEPEFGDKIEYVGHDAGPIVKK